MPNTLIAQLKKIHFITWNTFRCWNDAWSSHIANKDWGIASLWSGDNYTTTILPGPYTEWFFPLRLPQGEVKGGKFQRWGRASLSCEAWNGDDRSWNSQTHFCRVGEKAKGCHWERRRVHHQVISSLLFRSTCFSLTLRFLANENCFDHWKSLFWERDKSVDHVWFF